MIIIRKFSRDEARAAAKMLNALDEQKGETANSILKRGCQGVFNGSKRITGIIEVQGHPRPHLLILRKQSDVENYVAGVVSKFGHEVDTINAVSS